MDETRNSQKGLTRTPMEGTDNSRDCASSCADTTFAAVADASEITVPNAIQKKCLNIVSREEVTGHETPAVAGEVAKASIPRRFVSWWERVPDPLFEADDNAFDKSWVTFFVCTQGMRIFNAILSFESQVG